MRGINILVKTFEEPMGKLKMKLNHKFSARNFIYFQFDKKWWLLSTHINFSCWLFIKS